MWTEKQILARLAQAENAFAEGNCPCCGQVDEDAIASVFAGRQPKALAYIEILREFLVLWRALGILADGILRAIGKSRRHCPTCKTTVLESAISLARKETT